MITRKMNIIKAVLFDLDDTLFDHRHSSRSGLAYIRNKFECLKDVSLDTLEKENIALLEEIHLNQVLTGKLSIDQARADRFELILKMHNMNYAENFKYEAAGYYREVYESASRLVPGAEELLKKLKGSVKIGVVTNNLLSEQTRKLKELGIHSFIDELVTSEEVGITKPDPLIFQTTLDRLKCRADEVVMIGDSWKGDILGAHNIGIRTIWLNVFKAPRPDISIGYEIMSLENTDEIYNLIFNSH